MKITPLAAYVDLDDEKLNQLLDQKSVSSKVLVAPKARVRKEINRTLATAVYYCRASGTKWSGEYDGDYRVWHEHVFSKTCKCTWGLRNASFWTPEWTSNIRKVAMHATPRASYLYDFVERTWKFLSPRQAILAELHRMDLYAERQKRLMSEFAERQVDAYEAYVRRWKYRRRKGQKPSRWTWRVFTPRPYRPRYYDFGSNRFLLPTLASPGPRPQHECNHLRERVQAGGIEIRYLRTRDPWKFQLYPPRESMRLVAPWVANGWVYLFPDNTYQGRPTSYAIAPVTLIPLKDGAPDRSDLPDSEKLSSAVQDCLMQSDMQQDLPLFLWESRDVIGTVKTYMQTVFRLYDSLKDAKHLGDLISTFKKRSGPGYWRWYAKTSANQLWELAHMLSGADLARKFGQDPTIRDMTGITKACLGLLEPLYEKLAALVRVQGKTVTRHRTVDRSHSVTKGTRNLREISSTVLNHIPPEAADVFDDPSYFEEAKEYIRQLLAQKKLTRTTLQDSVWKVTPVVYYVVETLMGTQATEGQIITQGFLDYFGLQWFRPSLLWEHLRYSFVVDWLVNVGELIRLFDQSWLKVNPTVSACVLTEHTYQRMTVSGGSFAESHIQPIDWSDRHMDSIHVNVDVTQSFYEIERFRRWLLTDQDYTLSPSTRLRFKGLPSAWEFLTGTELLISAGPASWR